MACYCPENPKLAPVVPGGEAETGFLDRIGEYSHVLYSVVGSYLVRLFLFVAFSDFKRERLIRFKHFSRERKRGVTDFGHRLQLSLNYDTYICYRYGYFTYNLWDTERRSLKMSFLEFSPRVKKTSCLSLSVSFPNFIRIIFVTNTWVCTTIYIVN